MDVFSEILVFKGDVLWVVKDLDGNFILIEEIVVIFFIWIKG